MSDAFILAYARSPIAKAAKGSFAYTRIDDIAAQVVRAIMDKVPSLDPSIIEDVLIGCAMPEGEQGLNVARNVSFLAGLPLSAGAVTVNRFCASSLEAINQAAQAIVTGNGNLFLAGGLESMSHVPMGGFNQSLNEKLCGGNPDAYISMGLTAENLAKRYSITRDEQDRFAFMSHRKALSAMSQGWVGGEVIRIEAMSADGATKMVSADECPRPGTSIEALSALPPAFLKGGTVTAGNSSPMADGAAMVLIASKSLVKKLKIKPLARIRAMAVVGCDPAEMGMGPLFAVPKALARAKMKLADIDLIELNEAFAAQTLAVMHALGLDEKKVNVHGGAIALGHPLGMSGARIMTTLVNAMAKRGAATGLTTMCVGGGQGVATVVDHW